MARPGFWALAIFAAWCAMIHVPRVGPLVIAYRWPVGVVAGVAGFRAWGSMPRLLVSPGGYRLGVWGIALIAAAALASTFSVLQVDSFLRAGGVALVLGFGVFGCLAWFSRTGGVVDGLICAFGFSMVGVMGLVFESVASGSTGWSAELRFQGSGIAKATGSGVAMVAALPLVAWCGKYYYQRFPLLFHVFGLLLAYLVISTRSRTAIGAMVIVLPAAIVALRSVRFGAVVFGVLSASLLVVAYVESNEDARAILRLADDGSGVRWTTGRAERWETVAQRALERPVIGRGVGMSRYHHLDDRVVQFGSPVARVSHNEHLAVFYDMGAVGVVAFWGLLGLVFSSGLRIWRTGMSMYRDALLMVFLSWFVVFIDTASHNAYLTIGNSGAYMFWMQGTLVVCGARFLEPIPSSPMTARSPAPVRPRWLR